MQNNKIHYYKAVNIFIKLAAIFLLIMGTVVLVGWLANIPKLATLGLGHSAMKINASLIFILFGLANLLPYRYKNRLGRVIYIIIFIFSSLILTQYIFDINLGIDDLLSVINYSSEINPSRPSQNTLICFIYLAIGSSVVIRYRYLSFLVFVALLCGISSFVLSALSLIGYLVHIDIFYTWLGLSQMSPSTTLGILLLSVMLIAQALFSRTKFTLSREFAYPLLAYVVCFWFILVQWQKLIKSDNQGGRLTVSRIAVVIKNNLNAEFSLEQTSLRRFFLRIDNNQRSLLPLWENDSDMYFNDYANLDYLLLMDNSQIYKQKLRNSLPTASTEAFKSCSIASINKNSLAKISIDGNYYICVPFVGKNYRGSAVINLNKIITNVVSNNNDYRLLNLELYIDNQQIFKQNVGKQTFGNFKVMEVSERGVFITTPYTLKIWSSREFLLMFRNETPVIFLFFGGLLSILIALLTLLIKQVSSSNIILRKSVQQRTALLEKKNQEYKLLYDGSPELNVTISADVEHNILICNHTFIRTMEFDSSDKLIGVSIFTLCDEQSKNKLLQSIQEFFDTGATVKFELTLVSKNSQNIYVSTVLQIVKTKDKQVHGIILSMRDISRERELENELLNQHLSQTIFKQNEQLYNTILNSVTDGWWDWEIGSQKIIYSDNVHKLFGFDAANSFGNNFELWSRIIDPQDRERIKLLATKHINDNQPFNITARFSVKSNETLWVIIRGYAIADQDGVKRRMIGTFTDVTDKYSLITKLTHLSKFQKAVLDGTADLIISTDVNGLIITFNKGASALLGYSPEEVINIHTPQIIHDGDEVVLRAKELSIEFNEEIQPGFEVFVYKTNRNGLPDTTQWTYISKDGTRNKVELVVTALRDEHNAIYGYIGVGRNITELIAKNAEIKRSQDLLLEEKTRLANVIESTSLGTWVWNVQTGETKFNERWAEMIGYRLDEISPTNIETWRQFAHPDDLSQSGQKIKKHFAGELDSYYCESRMKHKDGHWVWVLDCGKVTTWTEDGKPLLMYGTKQDISQFKQLQFELQNSANKFKNLFDLAPVGIAMNDFENGHFIEVNNTLLASTGYSLEELIALGYWDLTPQEYEKQELEQLEALKKTGCYGPYRKEYIKKDGSRYPILLNGILTRDEFGKEVIWSIILDISNQLKYEQQLIEARKIAEAASLAKSQFVANMSHEIRTPMNAIIGLSQLLADTNLSRSQHNYIEKILGSSKLLLGIINDILDYSKIESGNLTLEKIDFNLDAILMQLITLFHANNRLAKDLEFFINIDPSVPYLLVGDQLRIMQVLTNLISNAVKFTEHGQVVLSISNLATDKITTRLKFSIADTGIGITPEQQANLFKPFSQSDVSITRKYGGTGLGLVISSQILKAMDSSITLESTYGVGTTFSFELELGYKSINVFSNLRLKNKAKALLVDDEPITRQILSKMLERLKIEVYEASDAEYALKIIQRKEHDFDYILMDYKMSGMSGLEAIRKIKRVISEDKSRKTPKIVLISGYTENEMRLSPSDNITLLAKPLTQTALVNELFPETQNQDISEKRQQLTATLNLTNYTILLVEDNLINQEVASTMLSNVGANIIIANNGQEAVDLVIKNSSKIDLILMDIQMPVKDGYQASREILEFDPQKRIIALTATVMREDVIRIAATGIKDHIAKPIEREKMFQTIAKWLDLGIVPEVTSQTVSENSSNELIDKQYALDILGGNEKLLNKLLRQFKEQLQNSISTLQRYIDSNDTKEPMHLIHTLKGVAGNLGAIILESELAKVEKSLRNGNQLSERDYDNCKDLIYSHIEYIEENTTDIRNVNEQLQTEENIEILLSTLHDVKNKIKNYEIIDSKTIEKLYNYSGRLIGTNLITDLVDSLSKYEVEEAQIIIEQIFKKLT